MEQNVGDIDLASLHQLRPYSPDTPCNITKVTQRGRMGCHEARRTGKASVKAAPRMNRVTERLDDTEQQTKCGAGRGAGTGANSRVADGRNSASGEAADGSVHAAKVAVQQPVSTGVVMLGNTGTGMPRTKTNQMRAGTLEPGV